MRRSPLPLLLAAALALGPAGSAVAAETTSADDPVATGTSGPTPALGLLAELVDAITAALAADDPAEDGEGDGAAAGATLDDAARGALAELLDGILEGIKVQLLVATAEPLDDGGDAGVTADDEAEGDEAGAGAGHGEIVSTVARCAPRGQGLSGLLDSVRTHGEIVRTAARGGSVTLEVPTLAGSGTDVTLTGETTTVTHELGDVAAAEALCTDLATIAAAAALSQTLAADDVEDDGEVAATDDRDADRDERREAREAAKQERAAERDAAKAARREARAARQAERAERAEARAAGATELDDDDGTEGSSDEG
jgi:hypothetical protein